MTDTRRSALVKGAYWIAATRASVSALGFISTLVLARLLVPEDFGLVAIASSIAMIAASVTELSLSQALVQRDSVEDSHFDTAWTLGLIRSGLFAAVLVFLSHPVASLYGDTRLAQIFLALGAGTLLGGMVNPRLVLLERELVFWQEFVLSFGEKAVGFVVAVTVALIFRSYWALVLGGIAAQATRALLSFLIVRYRPRLKLEKWRDLLSFSAWLTVSKAIQMANWRFDPILIGGFINPSALGFYTMGSQLAGMPLKEGLAPIRQTLFPAYSQLKNFPDRLLSAYLRTQGIVCYLAFPIGFGFAAISSDLIPLLLGEKWRSAIPVVQILSVAFAFQMLEGNQSLAMACGKTRALAVREFRTLLVRVPLILAGIATAAYLGIDTLIGAALGASTAGAVNTVWNMQLIKQLVDLRIRRQIMVGLRPLVLSAIMAFAMICVSHLCVIYRATWPTFVSILIQCAVGIFVFVTLVALAFLWLRPRSEAENEIVGMFDRLIALLRRKLSI